MKILGFFVTIAVKNILRPEDILKHYSGSQSGDIGYSANTIPEAQVSLYHSPDINRLIEKCLLDEISTNDVHLGYTFPFGSYVKTMPADVLLLELGLNQET